MCGKLTEDGDSYREHLVNQHDATPQLVEELFNRNPSIFSTTKIFHIVHNHYRSVDGSTDDLVACSVCDLSVEEGDKYWIHLGDVHNVSMEDVEQME